MINNMEKTSTNRKTGLSDLTVNIIQSTEVFFCLVPSQSKTLIVLTGSTILSWHVETAIWSFHAVGLSHLPTIILQQLRGWEIGLDHLQGLLVLLPSVVPSRAAPGWIPESSISPSTHCCLSVHATPPAGTGTMFLRHSTGCSEATPSSADLSSDGLHFLFASCKIQLLWGFYLFILLSRLWLVG